MTLFDEHGGMRFAFSTLRFFMALNGVSGSVGCPGDCRPQMTKPQDGDPSCGSCFFLWAPECSCWRRFFRDGFPFSIPNTARQAGRFLYRLSDFMYGVMRSLPRETIIQRVAPRCKKRCADFSIFYIFIQCLLQRHRSIPPWRSRLRGCCTYRRIAITKLIARRDCRFEKSEAPDFARGISEPTCHAWKIFRRIQLHV
jgi:hypothetical protein